MMAAMHEKMHQRTGEKWQPDEHSEYVSPMLREQKRACNDQESEQHQAGSSLYGHAFAQVPFMTNMISQRHLRVFS